MVYLMRLFSFIGYVSVKLQGHYDLEIMWEKSTVVYFRILSWHLSGGTDENMKNLGWSVL
jgi:hypothetical protein